ncbi:MAG: hypothetical protein FJ255_10245 [Phycisphaerae bacterium]|nr:hypothetical protein [Phycisphaerae bacterium]
MRVAAPILALAAVAAAGQPTLTYVSQRRYVELDGFRIAAPGFGPFEAVLDHAGAPGAPTSSCRQESVLEPSMLIINGNAYGLSVNGQVVPAESVFDVVFDLPESANLRVVALFGRDEALFDMYDQAGEAVLRLPRNRPHSALFALRAGRYRAGAFARVTPSSVLLRGGMFSVTLTFACRADMNVDGGVDFNDVLEFLNAYAALDPRADVNEDGAVDFTDFVAYLDLFNAGC